MMIIGFVILFVIIILIGLNVNRLKNEAKKAELTKGQQDDLEKDYEKFKKMKMLEMKANQMIQDKNNETLDISNSGYFGKGDDLEMTKPSLSNLRKQKLE